MPGWITAIGVAHLLRAVTRAGHDPAPLVARFKLPTDPSFEQRIAVATLIDAWEAAIELTKSRALPVLAATYAAHDERSWLTFVAANQPTLRALVDISARYYATVSDAYGWRYHVGDELRIACEPSGPIDRLGWQAYLEFEATDIARVGRRFTGGVSPTSVSFLHAAPDDDTRAALARELGVIPRFAQPACDLIYPGSVLDLTLPGARPNLATLVEQKLSDLLDADKRGAAISMRVRAALPDLMRAQRCSVDDVARALAMSRRSLERALADEDTSASALLDEQRKELALAWLPELSVNEVADRLGYSDVRAFARAFKRWTGKPPSDVRRRINSDRR